MISGLTDFRHIRWFRTVNRSLQIVLALSFITIVNIIAVKHFVREDITGTNRFSLSPETVAYLRELEAPVEIFVTLSPASKGESRKIFEDVSRLLREYSYHGRIGGEQRVHVEFVDIYQQRNRAAELANRFDLHRENSIIVASGDKHIEIMGPELYEVKDGEIRGFRGEQVFTSAMLDVARSERQKIYFLAGHGEMRLDDVSPRRGLSEVAAFLQQRNYELQLLDLSRVGDVPADAELVVIAGPRAALLGHEVEKLRRYLSERNGRVMVLLEPARQHGLEDLFFEWGILADDMLIVDTGEDFQAAGGDLIVRRFRPHPITEFLTNFQLTVLKGPSQPVRPDPGAPFDERLSTVDLLFSSDTSWGERSYRVGGAFEFDPRSDLAGPVALATLAQRRVDTQLGISIPGGRLIVFGNADFISNQRFGALGNTVLFNNSIGWVLDRNVDLLNIPPRSLATYNLTLSRADMLRIGVRLFTLPGVVAIAGLIVFVLRRR